jgi:hypothetical protein
MEIEDVEIEFDRVGVELGVFELDFRIEWEFVRIVLDVVLVMIANL